MVDTITPKNLAEALALRKNDQVIPFAGGTDLMVRRRGWAGTLPGFESPVLMIGEIPELKEIRLRDGILTIGSAATLTSIMEHQAVPEILKRAAAEMASPAIRNMGTLGGNVCNASPAADTLPALYALESSLLLQSISGRREAPIEDFIKGPGRTSMTDDELLVAVNIPINDFTSEYYKKVGTRRADALSKVSFVGLARTSNGVVEDIRIALGAVAPKVARSREAEALFKGKKISELPKLINEAKNFYANVIQPIDDQRSNAVYRRTVSLKLIEHFITQVIQ
jgi:xanthine dehydrogenase FAD-binding subunit